MNRVRTRLEAGAACRQRQAQSCREDRRGRCQDPRSQSWTPRSRLVLCRRRLSLLRASCSLHPRAGLRRQYVIQTEEPNYRRSTQCVFTRSLGGRARFRQSRRRPRHATDLSSHRRSRAGSYLRRRTGLPARPRDRKKLKTARLDLSATEALTASSPCVWSTSILATAPPSARSPWHSARRRSAARPRHHRPRSADPPQPGQTIV